MGKHATTALLPLVGNNKIFIIESMSRDLRSSFWRPIIQNFTKSYLISSLEHQYTEIFPHPNFWSKLLGHLLCKNLPNALCTFGFGLY